MNSNRTVSALLMAVIVALLASHLAGSHRVSKLERQIDQLQQELAQQRVVPPQQQVLAQQPVPEQRPQDARATTPTAAPVIAAFPMPETVEPSAQPTLISHEPSQDQVHLTTVQAIEQKPIRVSELSEDELEQVVAGELLPGAGIAAAGMTPPPALPESTSPPAQAENTSQRLAPRVERGGVLLRKGRTQVEPTLSYSHISKNRVGLSGFSIFDVIFIGEIRAEEVKRDLYTSSLSIRHGLTDTLQAEVDLPAQLQREESLSGPIESRQQTLNHYHGFNDVSGGLLYQFLKESGNFPAMIAHLHVKAPTGNAPRFGSGVWGMKGGLTMVKSSDPVALFSNMAYTQTFSGQVNGVNIDPGNAFEYNLGLAYALNYHLAVNASFEQVFIGESTQNGTSIPGSRLVVANFKTGLTYAFTKNFSVDASVGTGLTADSPDLSVSVSFPYTF